MVFLRASCFSIVQGRHHLYLSGLAESITIQGTKASAHLQSGMLKISLLDGQSQTHGKTARTGAGADPMAFTHAWHKSVIEDFARALTEQRTPLAPGKEALLSHAVIDAMQHAGRSERWEKINPL